MAESYQIAIVNFYKEMDSARDQFRGLGKFAFGTTKEGTQSNHMTASTRLYETSAGVTLLLRLLAGIEIHRATKKTLVFKQGTSRDAIAAVRPHFKID